MARPPPAAPSRHQHRRRQRVRRDSGPGHRGGLQPPVRRIPAERIHYMPAEPGAVPDDATVLALVASA